MNNKTCNQKGFSLTELSVVIIIMALIIASVMTGSSLMERAKIRGVIAEVTNHKLAVNSFNAKFDYYPGDFNESSEYWSGSIDGNGDGNIEFVSGGVYEGYLAWQNLAYAKMTNNPFVGTRTDGIAQVGIDIPESRTGGGYFFEYESHGFSGRNNLVLGLPLNIGASDTNLTVNGILTPDQAFEVDSKMDDGSPISGNVRGQDGENSTAESCINLNPDNDALTINDDIYALDEEGTDCTIAFIATN